jgi:hypothetical protein
MRTGRVDSVVSIRQRKIADIGKHEPKFDRERDPVPRVSRWRCLPLSPYGARRCLPALATRRGLLNRLFEQLPDQLTAYVPMPRIIARQVGLFESTTLESASRASGAA